MKSKVLIAAIAAQGFFRCGMHFPQKGVPVDLDTLGEDIVERLRGEPQLRISPLSEEELARLEGDADGPAELRHELAEAIRELAAQDFQQNGKPKVDALKVLLPDAKITAALRDEVWDSMVENGFTAPTGAGTEE